MFKLAISAGHYLGTAKGCPKSLDPKQTREWTLNDRIADKLEKLLTGYDGIEVLRLDDTTGKTSVSLDERSDAANKWGADFYLSIHHNGGINGGKGGGIVAFVYTEPSAKSLEWQKALYNAAIAATGLKGNRSNPLPKKNLHEVREPKMPAVLMECGFMDSATDCPIILTEDFADKMAKAFCEVIVEKSGATKKKPAETSTDTTEKTLGEVSVTLPQLVTLPVIGVGSRGAAVKTVQRLLNALGYHDANEKALAVDGIFGNATLYAVKAFQTEAGIGVDGIVGSETYKALWSA